MSEEQPAIPAATLIVMRDRGDGPPDLLLVERSAKMAFAGGAIVFPGGRVDAEDRALAKKLGRPDDGHKLTAIRETLEESAVAIGLGDVDPAYGLEWQQALLDGEPFFNLVDRLGLTPNLDALAPFARWKPSFHQTRRFDTIFFLARAPNGDWSPRPQPGECETAEWQSAQTVLARIEAGQAGAIFPTKRNLERLARFGSFEEAVADAARYPLDTIVPWVEERDGGPHIVIPADRGYPVTSEPLTSAVRA